MEKNLMPLKETTLDSLKSLINSWISESPSSRNYSALARSSNVSEACIRRIMNNNSVPIAENILKIVSFIKGGTISEILTSLNSGISNKLKYELSYLNFEELKNYKPIPEFENELLNFSNQVIFERSAIGSGISKAEIKEMFGPHGLNIADHFCKVGLCKLENEMLKCINEIKNHSWSTSLYKSFLSQSVKEFYKTDSQTNFLFVVNDGVSKKGYGSIMDVMEKAYKDIQHIVNENPGEIPVTLGGFMDTLTFDNVFKKNEETI